MKQFALLLVLGGCAMKQAAPEPTADDDRDFATYVAQFEALRAQSAAACPRLCELAESICTVSEKICNVSRRHADRADMADRCKDAEKSCDQGRADCKARCGR